MLNSQIKSRERVRDLGEVLTGKREIKAMLSLLPKDVWTAGKQKTFLEPSCGTGNFLEEILQRKISHLELVWEKELRGWRTTRKPEAEFQLLQAVASLYGVDICPYNVETSQLRLENVVREWANKQWGTSRVRKTKHKISAPLSRAFESMLNVILTGNIRQADFLNPKGQTISIWSYPKYGCLQQEWHLIANLGEDFMGQEPPAVRKEPVVDFYSVRRVER
jgi:hypothetical protein